MKTLKIVLWTLALTYDLFMMIGIFTGALWTLTFKMIFDWNVPAWQGYVIFTAGVWPLIALGMIALFERWTHRSS